MFYFNWCIIINRLYNQAKDHNVKHGLEILFRKSYGEFFFNLTKREKRTLLKEIPFILSLAVFKALWEIFPSSREGFTRRFSFKIIKLWYFLVQGISISSIFIENTIEKYLKQTPLMNPCKCSQLPNVWVRWFLTTLDQAHEAPDTNNKNEGKMFGHLSTRGSSLKGIKIVTKYG